MEKITILWYNYISYRGDKMLDNKLGITNEIELAKEEERITKLKALELFDLNKINEFEVGTFKGLASIHNYLFSDIYDFAGKVRDVNIAKGNFRFAPVIYLEDVLKKIDEMPQDNFENIVKKYVEMNVAHPFREGNGRSTRIWLDMILKNEIGKVIDWSKVNKEEYLLAMERSPIKDTEIKILLENALTDEINNRVVYMKGIDASYKYEGYSTYTLEELDK
jgi:cell filamentation protein